MCLQFVPQQHSSLCAPCGVPTEVTDNIASLFRCSAMVQQATPHGEPDQRHFIRAAVLAVTDKLALVIQDDGNHAAHYPCSSYHAVEVRCVGMKISVVMHLDLLHGEHISQAHAVS